ncbi:MAG: hypothetical protein HVN34_12810 [Methanobacteriaceae archaeon]|nr:hypothetical protein [Methanobacteriaceae archaeon]
MSISPVQLGDINEPVDFMVLDAPQRYSMEGKYFENTCGNPFFFQNLPYSIV